ncbi:thioredoxin domain-containing protein [Thermaurantimonas aggregans]|nr:thioredoxin domain-containing protein [Thermaurantimonas aggregans]MCX8148894.1 thioredoxin domain-containing protein [Thermaurantimonas aggregans]
MMNRLINAASPYLLQHAHNPVDWYPWGEEAFQAAKRHNKLLVISIGYSACHWCHVMERECFEDREVARLMNTYYISIKVDREEHPDVDQIYMDALQLMTGRGGWPLNIVALPDGRPIWGVTYLPKKSWMSALEQIAELQKNNPNQLYDYANKLSHGISILHTTPDFKGFHKPERSEIKKALDKYLQHRDFETGGPSRAPKFMMPTQLLDILRLGVWVEHKKAVEFVHLTLQQMARRGIFDQTVGGFYRYSTDAEWKIPHFEKMLYDNALLIELYAEAFKQSGDQSYLDVLQKTFDWLEAEMKSNDGGYYAALDADAEGEEGKTYTFTTREIEKMLEGLPADFLRDVYALHPGEQWEGQYVLHQKEPLESYAEKHHLSLDEAKLNLDKFLKRAKGTRAKKPRPGIDDKVIASWNLMLVSALVTVFEATGKTHWLEKAIRLANFIHKIIDHKAHYYKNGQYLSRCLLDDLSQIIRASIRLFAATGDEIYLTRAQKSLDRVFEVHDTRDKILFTNTPAHDNLLFQRAVETEDNVIPSSNAVMAENLMLLGHILGKHDYTERSLAMLNAMQQRATEHPEAYYHWWYVYLMHASEWKMYVITGPSAHTKALEYRQKFLPDGMVISAQNPSEVDVLKNRFSLEVDRLYLCEGESCRPPVELKKAE